MKAELEAALARAKIQFQGATRVSPSPDVVVAEPKKKVLKLEKALEVFGDSTGPEVDFLKKALAKAHEVARERPLEVQIKECREFISRSEQRVARLEADQQAELALLTEGKSRLSRLESQQLEAPRQQPEPGVTELEQRNQALVRECEALRAAATPVLHQEKPIWCSERCPSLDNIPPVPDDARRGRVVKLSKLRVEKCVGVWGSRHHRFSGQTGGARSFQVGSSYRGCPHVRAYIEQSRRGGCETEVFGRQVNIAVHGGEPSPTRGPGIVVQSTRVVRTVHSRCGIRVGKAAKRRRRVVASDTELDPQSNLLDDLEKSQVAFSLVVRPSRSSRRLVLIGCSQDTTVVAPSNVERLSSFQTDPAWLRTRRNIHQQ